MCAKFFSLNRKLKYLFWSMGSVQKWEFFKGQRGLDTESLPHICFANILLNVFFLSNFFCQFFFCFSFSELSFFFISKFLRKKISFWRKKRTKKLWKKKISQIVPKKLSGRNLRGTVPQATWPLKYSFFQWPHASKKIFWVFHSDRKTSHKQTASSVLLLQSFVFTCFRHKPFLKIIKPLFQKKKAVESRLRFIRLLAQKRKRWQVHFLFFVQSCFFKANFSNFKKKSFFLLQLLPRKIIRTHSEANYNFLIFA